MNTSFRYATVISAVAALVAVEIAASAQSEDANDAQPVNQLTALEDCRAEPDSTARLACYDAAVAELLGAAGSGDVRLVAREEIEQTRRGLFGFSMPKLGLFGGGDDDGQDTLQSTITRVRPVGRQGYELTIAEGSVWQVSNPSRRFRPEVGDEVELERAALGSFWVRVNGRMGEKGRRVR